MGCLLIELLSMAAPNDVLLDFCRPEDLSSARAVYLAPEPPEETIMLIPEDRDRPSLWYAPVAAYHVPPEVLVWYQRVDKGEPEYMDQRVLCLGIWQGGQGKWITPDWGGQTAWGGPNNVVLRRSPRPPTWGGFNVFQILRVKGQFEMLYWDQPEQGEKAGALRASSVDGKNWQAHTERAVFTEHNDAFTLLKADGRFLLYQTMLEDWPDKPVPDNLPGKRRVIALRTSSDLEAWSPQQVLLQPDVADDPRMEFYLFKAFRYGDGFAGLLLKYLADPATPNKHSSLTSTELLLSDNARDWRRPFRDTDLGFWTYADPFVIGGDIHFVAWQDRAMVLYKYRRNRLLGVVAGAEIGEFVTRPFFLAGEGLSLNADTRKGWVEVELLDEEGAVLSVAPSRMEGVDETRRTLLWQHSSRMDSHVIRLRIRAKQARVFAVTPVFLN